MFDLNHFWPLWEQWGRRALAISAVLLSFPAAAQKMGSCWTVINERQPLPTCEQILGTVTLVEEKKAATPDAILPPGRRVNGDGPRLARYVNLPGGPNPTLETSRRPIRLSSDRRSGSAFEAFQRERQTAQGQQLTPGTGIAGQILQAADYMLAAQIVYQDENGGGAGGGLGGVLGIKAKRVESQTMLTLTNVRTGVQEAVASGSVRKKDTSFIGEGVLGPGLGAIAGSYESTDIGKITAAALLDAYGKLIGQIKAVQSRSAVTLPAPIDAAVMAAPGLATPASSPWQ